MEIKFFVSLREHHDVTFAENDAAAYTGKPVVTDTRDRRTLAHNGQILIERNFSFIKSLKY